MLIRSDVNPAEMDDKLIEIINVFFVFSVPDFSCQNYGHNMVDKMTVHFILYVLYLWLYIKKLFYSIKIGKKRQKTAAKCRIKVVEQKQHNMTEKMNMIIIYFYIQYLDSCLNLNLHFLHTIKTNP